MTVGPIQLLALSFDRIDQFKGDIRQQLDQLRAHDTLRVVDLLFVAKEEDGTIQAIEGGDLTGAETQEVGRVIQRMMGLDDGNTPSTTPGEIAGLLAVSDREFGLSVVDVQTLANDIPPGKAAALLLVEHRWAIGLRDAIQAAHGRMVAQGFLTPDVLMMVGQELNAVAEAQEAIQQANIVKGAAMLDAMLTVAKTQAVKEAAVEEAAETVAAAAIIQNQAVAHTIETLIAAGVIEQVATERAIDALITAELLTAQVAEAAQMAQNNPPDAPSVNGGQPTA